MQNCSLVPPWCHKPPGRHQAQAGLAPDRPHFQGHPVAFHNGTTPLGQTQSPCSRHHSYPVETPRCLQKDKASGLQQSCHYRPGPAGWLQLLLRRIEGVNYDSAPASPLTPTPRHHNWLDITTQDLKSCNQTVDQTQDPVHPGVNVESKTSKEEEGW